MSLFINLLKLHYWYWYWYYWKYIFIVEKASHKTNDQLIFRFCEQNIQKKLFLGYMIDFTSFHKKLCAVPSPLVGCWMLIWTPYVCIKGGWKISSCKP